MKTRARDRSLPRLATLACLLAALGCGSKIIGVLNESDTAGGGRAGSSGNSGASSVANGGAHAGGTLAGAAGISSAGAAGATDIPIKDPRALMLVDSRLARLLSAKLETYRSLAQQRRAFAIDLRVVDGIDDWTFTRVHQYLLEEHAENPALQGVLFIGNIKLPSFYKVRNDFTTSAIYPLYYEDLDAKWTREQEAGTLDPRCTQPGQRNCRETSSDAAFTVPPHDFDHVTFGQNFGPEIWSAYMPLGNPRNNDYAKFAEQLEPYLDKLLRYYRGQIKADQRYYYVANHTGDIELLCQAYGATSVDFYGVPPSSSAGCFIDDQNVCYARNQLEKFSDCTAFSVAYPSWNTFGFFDQGWQTPDIFRAHMNSRIYEMVEVDVPGGAEYSILSPTEASQLTGAGLIMALDHNEALGFRQPASGSFVTTQGYASDNVAVGYLYGSSQTLAALGSPHPRGQYANHPRVVFQLKQGRESYLGQAHHLRKRESYDRTAGDSELLRAFGAEMLIGDPFMDLFVPQ